ELEKPVMCEAEVFGIVNPEEEQLTTKVEVKLEADDSGRAVWKLRNPESPRSNRDLVGKRRVRQGDRNDLEQFMKGADPDRIGIHRIEASLKKLTEEPANNNLLVAEAESGVVEGYALTQRMGEMEYLD